MKPRTVAAVLGAVLLCGAPASPHPDTPRRLEEVAGELQQRPGDPALLYRRGCLLLDEEYSDYPQAVKDFTAALKAPGIKDVRLFRGTALLRAGDLRAALQDLNRYVHDAPDDARGFERRSDARAAAKDGRGAIADLQAAARLAPRADLYSRCARLQVEAGLVPAAIRSYDDGIAKLNAPLELLVAAVDLAAAHGAHAKALEWLAAIESRGGRREGWVLRRAQVLGQAGRAGEARAAYAEVLALLDARATGGGFLSPTMRLEQAEALLGLGRREEAKAVAAALGATMKGRAEYQRLATELAR
jgi:tetratricopeptide (TPR) repeat protein